jgi:hypothetical protein
MSVGKKENQVDIDKVLLHPLTLSIPDLTNEIFFIQGS